MSRATHPAAAKAWQIAGVTLVVVALLCLHPTSAWTATSPARLPHAVRRPTGVVATPIHRQRPCLVLRRAQSSSSSSSSSSSKKNKNPESWGDQRDVFAALGDDDVGGDKARRKTRRSSSSLSQRTPLEAHARRRSPAVLFGAFAVLAALSLAFPTARATAFVFEIEPQIQAPLVRDAACSILAVVGAAGWLKIWTTLAASGAIDSRLSRKIIHCGSAPLFLLVWPFYSADPNARLVAAVVPALNTLRLVLAGLAPRRRRVVVGPGGEESTVIIRDDDDDEDVGKTESVVTAVSRSGDPREVLKGPLIYCVVLLSATLLGWRESVPALVAVAQMAIGDGVADIAGRRFGKRGKWWFSEEKSYAGSLAFALSGALATFGLLQWFAALHCMPNLVDAYGLFNLLGRIALISVLCALVELAPWLDDNISVPLAAALLAHLLL